MVHIAPEIEILHVDSTPNGGYALRILRAYRERCNSKWSSSSSSEEENGLSLVHQLMNDDQDKRAVELDEAINILTGGWDSYD